MRRPSKFITQNEIMAEAHSTSESVRGRLHKDQRRDFVLLDDFETNKTKDSKAYIDGSRNISTSSRRASARTQQCSISETTSRRTAWYAVFSIELRMMRVSSSTMCPSLTILERSCGAPSTRWRMRKPSATEKRALEDKKWQVGSVVFSAEMLNQPPDREMAILKREWFPSRIAAVSKR